MTATGMTGAADPQAAPGGPSPLVLITRLAIILVAVAALLSPLYVALRGSHYLDRPPPPFWGVNAGTGGTSPGARTAGGSGVAGFGGC